jgi:hypothetical protein
MRMARVVTLVLVLSFLLTLTWLGRLQHRGPARQDIELANNLRMGGDAEMRTLSRYLTLFTGRFAMRRSISISP